MVARSCDAVIDFGHQCVGRSDYKKMREMKEM